jgi:uncharacterized protein (TIGR03067 family)
MRFTRSLAAVTLLLFGVTLARADDAAPVPTNLDGQWLVAHRAYEPSDTNQPVADLLTGLGYKVQIAGGKLLALDDDKVGTYLSVTLDATATPPAIDLTVPGTNGRVLHGIYRLEDGVLSVAVGVGDARPTDFSISADQVLMVLKQVPQPLP